MSTDYYLKCNTCGADVLSFTNFDSGPQFFDVMKFLIEHRDTCNNKDFRLLDEHEAIKDELNRKEFVPKRIALEDIDDEAKWEKQ